MPPPGAPGIAVASSHVLALVLARRRRIRYAIRYPALDVLAGVVERERRGRWIPAALLLLALTALLLGAARPMARVPVPRDEATVMLVIDVSGSMNADDVEPTRMQAAQRAASRFLDRLPARFQVGLVIFSSEAETLVPPTTDRDAVRSALATLNANGGTAMGDGLARALDVIEAARQQANGGSAPAPTADPSTPGTTPAPTTPDPNAQQPAVPPAVTLLLSDGANSAGGDPFVQAERARQLRVPVHDRPRHRRRGAAPAQRLRRHPHPAGPARPGQPGQDRRDQQRPLLRGADQREPDRGVRQPRIADRLPHGAG